MYSNLLDNNTIFCIKMLYAIEWRGELLNYLSLFDKVRKIPYYACNNLDIIILLSILVIFYYTYSKLLQVEELSTPIYKEIITHVLYFLHIFAR